MDSSLAEIPAAVIRYDQTKPKVSAPYHDGEDVVQPVDEDEQSYLHNIFAQSRARTAHTAPYRSLSLRCLRNVGPSISWPLTKTDHRNSMNVFPFFAALAMAFNPSVVSSVNLPIVSSSKIR